MLTRIPVMFAILLITAMLAVPAARANPASTKAAGATPASSASAAAQSKPRVRTLIFGEGSELEGTVMGPNGETIRARTDLIHSNLIRVRADFLREIHKTAEDL